MDLGASRSGYRDVARDLASVLGMNYAYAPMQLELDPVLDQLDGAVDGASIPPDASRYKGVFGLAVLSRYPIKQAVCFQLDAQPYDWYVGELESPAALEIGRRYASDWLFDNEIQREVKIGGRIFFRVDLDVPGLPGDTLSLIHNHLEIKARPRHREAQLREIMSHIGEIPHVVVMAGDFNTTRLDWMFVKVPPAAQPDGEASYRLAPHYGETLSGLIEDLSPRLSDHSPCVVDLPLWEPPGVAVEAEPGRCPATISFFLSDN